MIELYRIKELCNQRGITLKQLGEESGISQTAITMSITRNSTTLETLEKIARYFGVSVGVFFGEDDIFSNVRTLFHDFDKEIQAATDYLFTTISFYTKDIQLPCDLGVFIDAISKNFSKEAVEIMQHSFNRIYSHPTYLFLKQLSSEQVWKMYKDDIITENVAVFVAPEGHACQTSMVDVQVLKEKKLSFWERLKIGFMDLIN